MNRNVGGADKGVRIALGLGLLAAGLLLSVETTVQVVLFVLAGIALVTGLVGFCPLNRLLGINTCKSK